MRADEVENRQAFFVGMQSEPSAELLEVNREAFGRTQKKQSIHFWNVDTFVVEVDNEDEIHLASSETCLGGDPLFVIRLGRQGDRGYSVLIEIAGHVFRVSDADAESQSASVLRIEKNLMYLLDNQLRTYIIAGINSVEILDPIAATLPSEAVEIDRVGDTEILEWAQQTAVNCIGKANLGARPLAEPMEHIQLVGALGSRSQPQQNLWVNVVQ